MAMLIIFTALAAWGLLCALWAALGWLLPGSGGAVMVVLCPKKNPEAVLVRCRWLRSLGLLPGRLVVAEAGPLDEKRYHDMEFCGLAEVPAILEAERERID